MLLKNIKKFKALTNLSRRYFSNEPETKVIDAEEITIDMISKVKTSYKNLPEDISTFNNPKAGFEYTILGHEFQALDITLTHPQKVIARSGSLSYFSENISFTTTMHGNIQDSAGRLLSGSSAFLMEFHNTSELSPGKLMLTPQHPSKIIPINLEDYSQKLLCHKDSFICGDLALKVTGTYIVNPITGLGSGEGFILQQLKGSGVAFLAGGGVVVKRQLRENEEVYLIPGSLLALDPKVTFKMQFIKGIKNILFGEGLFFIKVTGPGDVFVQSLSFNKVLSNVSSSLKNTIRNKIMSGK
ncbi:hypothetical protein SteCoe_1985 [Stentor coeruleus]|uniref:Uncharacterized protein n=1 Tax=Stentor coeruleus TaxID=5963 RepID=A0A1R2D0M6_9CILI|nr:hypothetical protein SteCoe_1985 [Stentor coeruleus]